MSNEYPKGGLNPSPLYKALNDIFERHGWHILGQDAPSDMIDEVKSALQAYAPTNMVGWLKLKGKRYEVGFRKRRRGE